MLWLELNCAWRLQVLASVADTLVTNWPKEAIAFCRARYSVSFADPHISTHPAL